MPANFAEPNAYSSLEDAIASFHGKDGHAVPNRFEVLITRPGSSATESRAISLRCESINLPGRNLNSTTDSNIYGPTREVVNGVTYAEDITMTFLARSGLDERVFFEEWQALAFDERTWNVRYYNDYISTVDIYILDRQDKRRFGIKLMEAFPKTIGPTELSQAPSNEVIKLAVTFSFRYWTTLDTDRAVSLGVNDGVSILNENSVVRSIAMNQPATVSKLNPFSYST